MKNYYICIVYTLCTLVWAIPGYGISRTLSDAEIDAKLSELKPLPKIHYYWPPKLVLLDGRNNKRLYELARITHSVCVQGRWTTEQEIDNSIYICSIVNKTNPPIKTSLGINFRPWHEKFDVNLPPTDRGPAFQREINLFEERISLIRTWANKANNKYRSDIKVGAITFDSERFARKQGSETQSKQWNEAIAYNYNLFTRKAKSMFPNARMEWYAKGIVAAPSSEGWARRPWHVEGEELERLSVEMYTVSEPDRMRESYRRTCRLADNLGYKEVTPWVALAAGFKRDMNEFKVWSTDWDYDLIYSWMIGAELNISWYGQNPERFAPYNRATVIVFYPPPFDDRSRHWANHFIAYVRGATDVKYLKDIELQ